MAKKVVTALNLTADLQAAGSSGTSGQVLTSSGSGAAPAWTSPPVFASNYVTVGAITTNQTVPRITDTSPSFTASVDPNSWWNATTKRFTPTVAGYYVIGYYVLWNGVSGATGQTNIQIQKSGVQQAFFQATTDTNTSVPSPMGGEKVVYLNGTTDYINFTSYTDGVSPSTGQVLVGTAGGTSTYFTAALLTIPSLPRIDLGPSTTQTITTASVTTVNTWSQTANTGGVFTLGSSQNVTVSKAGRYNLSIGVTWAANATGVRQIRVLVNTVLVYAVMVPTGANLTFQQELTRTDVSLAANDVVRIDVYQNSGGDLAIGGTTYKQQWTMTYLGT